MVIYVTISFISTFALFVRFSDALILPVSQLQTQQEMTSQIISHIMSTYYIFCAHYVVEILMKI